MYLTQNIKISVAKPEGKGQLERPRRRGNDKFESVRISLCGPEPVAGPCKHGNKVTCDFPVYDTV